MAHTYSIIRWPDFAGAPVVIVAMVATTVAGWLLISLLVFSSLLYTGIDPFMGFVLGPVMRRLDLGMRRATSPAISHRARCS